MNKLDDIIADNSNQSYRAGNGSSHKLQAEICAAMKQAIKQLFLEIVSTANHDAFDQGTFYREMRKLINDL